MTRATVTSALRWNPLALCQLLARVRTPSMRSACWAGSPIDGVAADPAPRLRPGLGHTDLHRRVLRRQVHRGRVVPPLMACEPGAAHQRQPGRTRVGPARRRPSVACSSRAPAARIWSPSCPAAHRQRHFHRSWRPRKWRPTHGHRQRDDGALHSLHHIPPSRELEVVDWLPRPFVILQRASHPDDEGFTQSLRTDTGSRDRGPGRRRCPLLRGERHAARRRAAEPHDAAWRPLVSRPPEGGS